MIIAIDGPAGSGKTTTALKVAQILGYVHINTGAMYRGIALKFIREKVNLDDTLAINRILNNTQLDFSGPNHGIIHLDGEDISAKIKSSLVTKNVSLISAISEVRVKLVEYQRQMAQGKNVVLEGRDIGTVVFPNADYKFYIVADIKVRAKRRKKEIISTGENISMEEVILFIQARDKKDSSRQHSPLMIAEDAIELDTTKLTIDEQVNYIINIVNKNQKGA
jgi:cytidylate kinase